MLYWSNLDVSAIGQADSTIFSKRFKKKMTLPHLISFGLPEEEMRVLSWEHHHKHNPFWPSAEDLARVPLENMCYYTDPVTKKYCNNELFILSVRSCWDNFALSALKKCREFVLWTCLHGNIL